MAGRVPRSVIVAVVLAIVVAAGAVGGAAAVRWRTGGAAGAPATSQNPPTTSGVGVNGCLTEQCHVLASTTVGATSVELVADAGLASGRLRIGGAATGQVFEATITGGTNGVKLTAESLQCIAGGPAACMIKGKRPNGSIAGEIIVGRSGDWSTQQTQFISDAGYLVLANIDADSAPEVIAAQHDCGNMDTDCSTRPVFAQVFALNGSAVGCTKNFPKLDRLPGYPTVHITGQLLSPCH